MFKGKVLGKRFNSAKCKSSLKLAVSRIKLLKNKKEAVVKQHRREIGQMIELGQVQNAVLQVENLIREEKTIAAYEYIEIFCEFIAARIQIIESQKTCPIDLKEAVSSVIFASPRCSDISELSDVKKHFEAKYGKEFVSAAVELRPDCGVYRTLVEKLSATRPDDRTKQKVLSSIAEEYMIKWDPDSYLGEDAELGEDPPIWQDNGRKDGVPMIVIPLQPDVGRHKAVINVVVENLRSGSSPRHEDNPHIELSVTLNPESRTSESGIGGIEIEQAKQTTTGSSRRSIGELGFTDATSAARAAAEAAEHASFAARAAVQLSTSGKYRNPSSSEIGAILGETRLKEARAESETLSEGVRNDQESEGDFVVFDEYDSDREEHRFDSHKVAGSDNDEWESPRVIDERNFSPRLSGEFRTVMENADRRAEEPHSMVDAEYATECPRLDLEKFPTSYKHGLHKFQFKGETSPRKLRPFFDSENEDSSEEDGFAGSPASMGKARIDPKFSRRTKKP